MASREEAVRMVNTLREMLQKEAENTAIDYVAADLHMDPDELAYWVRGL